jgi:hypothetical protein
MTGLAGSCEALRRLREQQSRPAREVDSAPRLLEQIPPDAPMDDATITVWDGERFVAYEKWLATAPVAVEGSGGALAIPHQADCVAGVCGSTRIWLVRDGDRWLMFAGSRKAGSRRKDFASPCLAHAMRTAEQWYGAPTDGWHTERGRNGSGEEASDRERAE